MGIIIILVVGILCLIGGVVQALLSWCVVGLVTAVPGSALTLILLLSWLLAGLPILCISPSRYSMVATCLALIACMFGAGLGPSYLFILSGFLALVVWAVVFIVGGLATLITTIISPCLPKIWLQWPYRLLLGGLRLAI